MRSRCWALATLLGVATGLSGCADRGQVVAPKGTGFAVASLDDVARAFALGMATPEIRADVRDAMRASRLTEHKLSLRDFAASANGERLLREAAQASGMPLADLRATIAALPDLDFYVPVRQHRLTWRATADYVVAVGLEDVVPTTGYDAAGHSVPLDFRQPEPPSQVVLMLQSAETKSPRIAPQPDVPGQTIQDPGDGEVSGSLVITDPDGTTRTFYLADMRDPGVVIPRVECAPEVIYCEPDPPPPPPPPSTQTYIERIYTNGVCDNACWESNEFEFRAVTSSGATNAIRLEGIPESGTTYLHALLIYAVPPMQLCAENCTAAARETDGWPNPDDLYYNGDYSLFVCGAAPISTADNGNWVLLREDEYCQNPVKVQVQITWVQ